MNRLELSADVNDVVSFVYRMIVVDGRVIDVIGAARNILGTKAVFGYLANRKFTYLLTCL